jgi:hypothetical protein
MLRRIFLFIISVPFFSLSSAQQPDEVLIKWSEQSPIEKVSLHLDREIYLAGETIWFKAYLFSEFLPDTISTSLYVELVDENSKIIIRKVYPVFFYSSRGQIELPDSLQGGKYFIRAYSPTMLNQRPEFIYKHGIVIFSNKNRMAAAKQNEKFIRLEFFPEGGNLISGKDNTVAFKATDQDGFPVNIHGKINNEQGEAIVSFSSFHDGMGKFSLTPAENEKYIATLEEDNGVTKYFLPASATQGIILKITADARGRAFEILENKDDPVFQAAYLIGQSQHKIVFKQQLTSGYDRIKGVIKTDNLISGILQVTVFNKDNMPLAERLVFINNKEYVQPALVQPDTLNFSNRGRNTFSMAFQDTVTGTFSISVTDPDFDLDTRRQENIISNLLLTSDLPGYIHDPAYYFSDDSDSVTEALDLVMLTNGWRRFQWKELLSGNIPVKNNEDRAYITLKGTIKINGSKKPFADQSLMVFVSPKDSTSSLQLIKTDSKGNFKLDSLVFFDYARILFFDIRGRKSKWIDVYPDGDSLMRNYPFPFQDMNRFVALKKYDSLSLAGGGIFSDEYNAFMKAKGLMLPGITVKVRKKSALEELEERYVSGLFSSGASVRTIDLTNETVYGQNILEYLRGRVPGLRVQSNGFDYQLYYRGINSFLYPAQMDVYLDEIRTDANMVASIPVSDIALVKVFDTFVGGFGNSPGGALAIYTKKGDDLYKNNYNTQQDNRFIYHGYSVIKEFYSPDYAVKNQMDKLADHRITLQWLPEIIVQGVDVKIPFAFYNNDRTRRYRVVVEGITTAGKMVCLEKIFGEEKSF